MMHGKSNIKLEKYCRAGQATDNNMAHARCMLDTFFFFHWCYNPLWVLAFSVNFFHSVLSFLNFLHPLTPIAWISSSTSSIHLFLGLPLILLPIDFHSSILLVLDTYGYKYTHRLCNTHCFSTATMVARTRLDVTLYVHCPPAVLIFNVAWSFPPYG
jgi:hypothetical protein